MTTIDVPILSDSVTNKQATQNGSLYHTCQYVLHALSTIHSLQPYLAKSDSMTASTSTPMSRLWHFCRQGTSLCILFNTLRPDKPIPLHTEQQVLSITTAQKPKAYVYHFIIACRDQLHFGADTLFTLKDVFQDDTNGFVRVINILKKVVEIMESQGIIVVPSSNYGSDTTAPKDTRDKIVIELLETERKYVQDLETLQSYMRQAKAQEILPPDTLHQLFGNLNALVDCQRRFLIQVEAQAVGAPQDQRFGQLFMDHEEDFAVYEPFCSNFQTAQALVCREQQALEKLGHLLTPSFELPSILIKPVQRLCKYPLLMKQLVKTTPSHWPFYDETKQGLDAIQRVAAKVNETRRRQENLVIVRQLKEQIDDWPASDIDDFGPLLLHDKFIVYRGDPGRELIVYLFEKCLFVCREEKEKEPPAHGKDGHSNKKSHKKNKKKDNGNHGHSSSSSSSASSLSSASTASILGSTGIAASALSTGGSSATSGDSASGNPSSNAIRLGVRGRILMSRVAQVNDTSQDGGAWTLQIFWSEKYLQPGQQFRLDSFTLKCRHQEQLQLWKSSLNRLIKQMKQQARDARAAAAAAASIQQQQQQQQQLSTSSETSTLSASYVLSHRSSSTHNSRDDDGDENSDREDRAEDPRSNACIEIDRLRHGDTHIGLHTSTSTSPHLLHNGISLPSLPRTSDTPPMANRSQSLTTHDSSALYTSLDGLHQYYYSQQQQQHVIGEHPLVDSDEKEDEDFDDDYDTYSSTITTPKTPPSFPLLSHQHHHTSEQPIPELMMMMTPSNNSSIGTTKSDIHSSISTRLRSQSSPNIHPSSGKNPLHSGESIPSVPAYQQHYQYPTTTTSRFDKRKSNGDQDIRRPLYSFDTSSTYSMMDQYQYYQAELPSSLGSTPTATKVKVHHLGSIYVLVVPLTIDYKSLVERIERKMNCDSTANTLSTTALAMTGLKYQDEDGDLITISSNDDLQMGFEQRGINNTVNFYIV